MKRVRRFQININHDKANYKHGKRTNKRDNKSISHRKELRTKEKDVNAA